MDRFFIDLRHLQRRWPSGLPIGRIAFVSDKTVWVDRPFVTTNFSFIVQGTGSYRSPAGSAAVRAPCVFMQPVGIPVRYGPDEHWQELSLLYDDSQDAELQRRRLHLPHRHVWHCREVAWMEERRDLLFELGTRLHEPGVVDRIDRICEHMVMTSLIESMHPDSRPADPAAALVEEIRELVADDPLGDYDFDRLARRAGVSSATFRRRWADVVGVPPARHVRQLRLTRAAQLLIDVQRPIADIAAELGFDDPLYFSRAFRRQFGDSPSAYRRRTVSVFE